MASIAIINDQLSSLFMSFKEKLIKINRCTIRRLIIYKDSMNSLGRRMSRRMREMGKKK